MIPALNTMVDLIELGLIPFQEAWDYQEKLFQKIVEQKQQNRKEKISHPTFNYLLFCEHPHVYTLGKSGKQSNLLINESFLESRGASLFRINRGGDITYHGPGQLVTYPILDLDNFNLSIKSYINSLEEVVIRTLDQFDIQAGRLKGATGVWLDPDDPVRARKICAMGVRTSHWVSMHGFALNIHTDLNYFNYIIPCGIPGKSVTSMSKEGVRNADMSAVKQVLIRQFNEIFGMEIQPEAQTPSFKN
ncbi:MAG: lipoyl(octanoyl) transferase LipB [bacterium]|jgi:lipoyl(octanoyl) transferase